MSLGKTKTVGACCNSVIICPVMNATTCPDTFSLAKYAIDKDALQILFNYLYKVYNTILITTSINDKAEQTSIMDTHTLSF